MSPLLLIKLIMAAEEGSYERVEESDYEAQGGM